MSDEKRILILGSSESGKSTIAKILIEQYKNFTDRKILVCDPMGYEWENADFVTQDSDELLEKAQKLENCLLFIDEAGKSIGRYPKGKTWFTDASRHNFHSVIICAHRSVHVSRDMIPHFNVFYLLSQTKKDAVELSEDLNDEKIKEIQFYKRLQFMRFQRFTEPKRGKIKFLLDGPVLDYSIPNFPKP